MLNLKQWQVISVGGSIICFFGTIFLLLMFKSSSNLFLGYLSISGLFLYTFSFDLSIILIVISSYKESTIIAEFLKRHSQIHYLSLSNLRLNSDENNIILENCLAQEIKKFEDSEKDTPKNLFFSLMLSVLIVWLTSLVIDNFILENNIFKLFSGGVIMIPVNYFLTRSIRRTRNVLQNLLRRVEVYNNSRRTN